MIPGFEQDSGAAVIGCGLAASGAWAAALLARLRPRHALLLGIAGTLAPERAASPELVMIERVGSYGIGVGERRWIPQHGGNRLFAVTS